MKTVRITLIVWGLISLYCPILSYSQLRLTKESTDNALSSIENEYLDLKSMTKEERDSYDDLKSTILRNEKAAWQIAQSRQKIVLVFSLGSAALSFSLAFYLPYLTRPPSKNGE